LVLGQNGLSRSWIDEKNAVQLKPGLIKEFWFK